EHVRQKVVDVGAEGVVADQIVVDREAGERRELETAALEEGLAGDDHDVLPRGGGELDRLALAFFFDLAWLVLIGLEGFVDGRLFFLGRGGLSARLLGGGRRRLLVCFRRRRFSRRRWRSRLG